ncbi:hypothetical protein BDB01DRAFT_852797 [Pilobolus umbonatus]|nr:hypothetical protein BDB01DRAFT_852797 [Pilobolus umbonatus]
MTSQPTVNELYNKAQKVYEEARRQREANVSLFGILKPQQPKRPHEGTEEEDEIVRKKLKSTTSSEDSLSYSPTSTESSTSDSTASGASSAPSSPAPTSPEEDSVSDSAGSESSGSESSFAWASPGIRVSTPVGSHDGREVLEDLDFSPIMAVQRVAPPNSCPASPVPSFSQEEALNDSERRRVFVRRMFELLEANAVEPLELPLDSDSDNDL